MTTSLTRTVQRSRPTTGLRKPKVSASETAARMMSETAHDLRSPLTTVRESIRLVQEGSMGEINKDQQECLTAAIDQCDCMDHMIGEMVQLERLRTGTPRVCRRWIPASTVRQAIDETLRPWALPRNIDVMWDCIDDPSIKVFADAAMLRRLVVNLVTNSIRVTAEGGWVLIRMQSVRQGEAIRWSVVDEGCGISEDDMRSIADRQVTFGGGEGLGLSICRQLAGLHFSNLRIRSRLGSGTEVSFETAAAGPRSVADSWSTWRIAHRGPLQKPSYKKGVALPTFKRTERRMRLDPAPVEIEVSHEGAKPRCEDRIAAGTVSVGATVSREASDGFDQLLQSQLQMFDLVYRISNRRWVWVFDVDAHGVQDRVDSITDAVAAKIPAVRLTWSDPQMIPVDERRTNSRLSDLLVRQALAAATSNRPMDKNEVRLGTAPIAHSEIAAARLDAELRRLTKKLQTQTYSLKQQVKNLRPKN